MGIGSRGYGNKNKENYPPTLDPIRIPTSRTSHALRPSPFIRDTRLLVTAPPSPPIGPSSRRRPRFLCRRREPGDGGRSA